MNAANSNFDRPIDSPYPGLRPFEQHESAIFFGRDEQIADMLTVLEDHRFLAAVGPSGSGKSSLVLAGLLPALRRGELLTARSDDWRFVVLRPGDAPYRNLAVAAQQTLSVDADGKSSRQFHDGRADLTEILLRGSPCGFLETLQDAGVPEEANVLLLVDQFEEIFRFREPERVASEGAAAERRNEAASFVQMLLVTARQIERPVHVLLTMRSDFLGDCDVFEGLPQAINTGQYLTPRLSMRQLEQAITKPPAVSPFGAEVDPAVVQRIANDIGDHRDELPVVQHALFRAWLKANPSPHSRGSLREPPTDTIAPPPQNSSAEKNKPIRLTLDHYLAVGGIREALSREADAALDECRQAGRERIAERIFRSLTQRGASGQYVRRPLSLEQLAAEADAPLDDVIAVIKTFRRPDRSFLVPAVAKVPVLDKSTRIDISHESLIRQWNTLRQRWLPAEEESESRFRRLMSAERAYRHGEGDLLPEVEMKRLSAWWENETPHRAWCQRYVVPVIGPGQEDAYDAVKRYLDKSHEAYEAEVAAEKQQLEAEQQRQSRELQMAREHAEKIQQWLVGVVLIAIVAVGLGVSAYLQSAEAIRQRLQADRHRASARQSENTARAVSIFMGEQVAWPTLVGGDMVDAIIRRDRKKVLELLGRLKSGDRAIFQNSAVSQAIDDLGDSLEQWDPVGSDDDAQLNLILSLCHACRDSWEREIKSLEPAPKKRAMAYIAGKTMTRAKAVTQEIALGSQEPRLKAEFERLYWSELVFLETEKVVNLMVKFRNLAFLGSPKSPEFESREAELSDVAKRLTKEIDAQFDASSDVALTPAEIGSKLKKAKQAYERKEFAVAAEMFSEIFFGAFGAAEGPDLERARRAADYLAQATSERSNWMLGNLDAQANFLRLLEDANAIYPYGVKHAEAIFDE